MANQITVIITTYNRSHSIGKCLTCVLSQTFENLEVIVVDDNGKGSVEQLDTSKNLQEFIEKGQISYFPMKQNSGACAARNYGASLASGKYIAFFDDDDEWDITKIEKQYDVIKQDENLGFVYCFQEAVDYKSRRVLFGTYDGIGKGNVYNNLLQIDKQSLATPNPLIRKSAFDKVEGFDIELKSAQDIDLFVRIAKLYAVDYVPEVLHKAIVHSSERISSNHGNKISGYKRFLSKYEGDLNPATLRYIHSRIIYHSYFMNDFQGAKYSIEFLEGRNILSLKYFIYALGLRSRFFGIILGACLRIKSAV